MHDLLSDGNTVILVDHDTNVLKEADWIIELGPYAEADNGATVIIIEHDLDVIKNADYIIDMGPGGGVHGGMIVASGTPNDIAKCSESLTGEYLDAL